MTPELGVLAAAVMLTAYGALLHVRGRRRRAHARRMHEARVKATALVIGFEHTPVRGPSRDRSRPGKARRQARRR